MIILSHDEAQDPTLLEDGMVAMATQRGEAYEQMEKANQDRVASGAFEDAQVDLIADGLGGYEDGAVAAQLLAESLQSTAEETLKKTLERYREEGLQSPAGTTLLHSRLQAKVLTISHIGDSRALLFSPTGKLIWQSQDHKPTEFLHRFKLTKYVHQMEEADLLAQLSTEVLEMDQDSILVLASDGISDNLKVSIEDQECAPVIGEIIASAQTPEQICLKLMELANTRMALKGTEEGDELDVKPDNSSCLIRMIHV